MNEQDFTQWLREKTDDTPIPEALLPEHMTDHLSVEASVPTKSKKWYQHPWLNAAAGFLLLGILTSGIWLVSTHHSSESAHYVEEESMMESVAEENSSPDAEAETLAEETTLLPSPIQTATDYQQIHSLLSNSLLFRTETFATTDEAEDLLMNDAVMEENSINNSSTNQNKSDYYDTNSQVAEVAEADIVKTDGTYIYTCYSQQNNITNAVAIAKTDDGHLTASGTIRQEHISSEIQCENFSITEMYVVNERLILLCDGATSMESTKTYSVPDISGEISYDTRYRYGTEYDTYILTYDISDPETPKLLASLVQDGSYTSSRFTNGCLYTFSTKYTGIPEDYAQYDAYIPHANDELLSCDDIFLPECSLVSSYQIMTGMKLEQPGEFASSKAILANNGTYYVSENHIYFAQETWETGITETEILKFSYTNGTIIPEGSTTICGYLINQFAMDEHEGYLRVAATTTENGRANALYVIDSDMNTVGTIDNLAPDEQIYSVRFMGDVGYFVTYQQTDPLFAVDLSNPENPQITDALKIPGFSNYLHFYSEDLLFGLGEETNPSTGAFMGLKLSMFDVSDPYQITEVDKVVLSDVYYSPAQYNHKALMINPERNLIGFYTEQYDDVTYEYSEYYTIYSYQPEEGFVEEFTCDLTEANMVDNEFASYEVNFYNIRGLYIGDYLYLVNGNHIHSYSFDSYDKIDGIILN